MNDPHDLARTVEVSSAPASVGRKPEALARERFTEARRASEGGEEVRGPLVVQVSPSLALGLPPTALAGVGRGV
jgi:hypothetical protein